MTCMLYGFKRIKSAGNKTPRNPSAMLNEFCGKQNTTQSFCDTQRVLRETKTPRNPSALLSEFSFDGTHDKCGKQKTLITSEGK